MLFVLFSCTPILFFLPGNDKGGEEVDSIHRSMSISIVDMDMAWIDEIASDTVRTNHPDSRLAPDMMPRACCASFSEQNETGN